MIKTENDSLKAEKISSTKRKGIKILEELGLTHLQARIYYTLLNFNKLKVSDISLNSNIARQDVYKILPGLLDLGLVEKIISKPSIYKVISIKDGINKLIKKQKAQNNILHSEAVNFGETFSPDKIKINQATEQFFIIQEKRALRNKIKKIISEDQNQIKLIVPRSNINLIFFSFGKYLLEAANRGIKILAISNHFNKERFDNQATKLLENKSFKIKSTNKNLMIRAALHDKKKLFLACNPLEDGLDTRTLFTTNEAIIELYQSHFNSLWTNL